MLHAAFALCALNVFSCLVLVLVIFRLLRAFSRVDRSLKLFLTMCGMTIALLLVDSAFWLVDGRAGLAWLNVALNLAYFIMQPFVPCLWLVYVMEFVPALRGRFGPRLALSGLPAFAHAAIVMTTPWTGWMFTVDAQGVYSRGPLFLFAIAGAYLYLIASLFVVLVAGRKMPSRVKRPLACFVILPGIAAAAQSAFYGIAVIWPAIALSFLIIYLWVEGEMLSLDYLTGLQNRRSLHAYLERRVRDTQSGRPLGALMVDLDDFKEINDTWGHQAGDEALRELARVMRACFHHQDFIARYAGDEFVVVLDLEDEKALRSASERFVAHLARLREETDTPWKLRASVGGCLFGPELLEESEPVNAFLDRVDRAMYGNKAKKEGRSG